MRPWMLMTCLGKCVLSGHGVRRQYRGFGRAMEHGSCGHGRCGVVMRLALTPILVVLLAWLTGLRGEAFEAAMICAAVPTAMNGYVLARTMGGDAELYAATATVQTVLSFGSIPLVIWLARHLPWLG